MGHVYRKQKYRPLPTDAELIQKGTVQQARWRDRNGKLQSAEVKTLASGEQRIVQLARTWTARYRDGSGIVQEVSTGCRDKQTAEARLKDLERRAELVKARVLTPEQDAISQHQGTFLSEHFAAYVTYLEGRSASPVRIANMRSQFTRICRECGFHRLPDLNGEHLTRWLVQRKQEGMSAATRNGYRETCVMFANWCLQTSRLTANPFQTVPKENVRTDRRRQRRALTEEELQRLLRTAQDRPLQEARTVRRGPHKGEPVATLNANTVSKLQWVGRERALIYKTLVLTGLRLNELASLTVAQVHLNEEVPYLELAAADEKNRQGSSLPLRADLAQDLQDWIRDRQAAPAEVLSLQSQRTTQPLFHVPRGMVRILNRDLEAAGIPKRDERGRTVDVHALRHTFGTWLSRGGVAPRTAQQAMRHSDIKLTMQTYTDPKLLDVQGALEALPRLSLTAAPQQRQAAGAELSAASRKRERSGVPAGAPKPVATSQKLSAADTPGNLGKTQKTADRPAGTSSPDNRTDRQSITDNRSEPIGMTRFELATSTSRT